MSDILSRMRTVNPRYPSAPARMADGRLFTDYRPSCDLLPKGWGTFDNRQLRISNGEARIANDRSQLTMIAGPRECVDTMVPELNKRSYNWTGGETLRAHPAGIGTGRMYLPARTDLVMGDPDALAAATVGSLPGTFSQIPASFNAPVPTPQDAWSARKNRYSMPYGN